MNPALQQFPGNLPVDSWQTMYGEGHFWQTI